MNDPATPRSADAGRAPERPWIGMVWIVAATALTAYAGAVASADAREFYGGLVQPSWAPPAAVFGPVWTTLYIMMAAAAGLVWHAAGTAARPALTLYALQLALNALWSWLFFRWHLGAWAFAEVLLLAAMVAWTMRRFGRIRRLAGWLMAPYLAWVVFASALTLAVWRLNPRVL